MAADKALFLGCEAHSRSPAAGCIPPLLLSVGLSFVPTITKRGTAEELNHFRSERPQQPGSVVNRQELKLHCELNGVVVIYSLRK